MNPLRLVLLVFGVANVAAGAALGFAEVLPPWARAALVVAQAISVYSLGQLDSWHTPEAVTARVGLIPDPSVNVLLPHNV